MASERKTVAIIGAGISGITSAKAMLEQHLQPTLFDSKPHLGGLWAAPPAPREHPFLVPRAMRTNLSKYTCVFSDFSWTDAGLDGAPAFPRAADVEAYLGRYWLRFAKDAHLRLGCVVVGLRPAGVDAVGAPRGWKVVYTDSEGRRKEETYDYVVLGTGFNSSGYTPPFANRPSFRGTVLHASEYAWDAVHAAVRSTPFAQKRIVVVGGSLSAAELVGEIALSVASLPPAERAAYTLVHLFSRPFWIAPKTIPLLGDENAASSTRPTLFPMDLVFYDLKQAAIPNFNEYMKVLVGGDQGDLTPQLTMTEDAMKLPTWVCLSNAYAGFARSGAVETVIGRLLDFSAEDPYALVYDTLDKGAGKAAILPDVSCVIMATGYTPYYTLQRFLAPALFAALTSPTPGKPTDYTFLPVLTYKQVLHPALGQTGGCVGVYKGPYFAVMELQARWLAALFAGTVPWPSEHELLKGPGGIDEMRRRRDGRAGADPADRGQWSWGDYVLIAEDICATLGIAWRPPSADPCEVVDPFVPERLLPRDATRESELARTVRAVGCLRRPTFVPAAAFRALQGRWAVEVRYTLEGGRGRGRAGDIASGAYRASATFVGRGRTDVPAGDPRVDPATVQEFLCEERGRDVADLPMPGAAFVSAQVGAVYRLDLAPTPSISLYLTLPSSSEAASDASDAPPPSPSYRVPLTFRTPLENDAADEKAWHATGELAGDGDYKAWFEYAFWFNGTEVREFEVKMTLKSTVSAVNVQTVARYRR